MGNNFTPKSLHTVSALANVARHLRTTEAISVGDAIEQAALILGQMGKCDIYKLKAAAVKLLVKEQEKELAALREDNDAMTLRAELREGTA